MSKKKILVVLSGGQDSTTCLFLALEEYGNDCVVALTFDYGQKHKVEIECAKKICIDANVEHIIVPIDGILGMSSLTNDLPNKKSGKHPLNNELPDTFVPLRNMLFLTIACSYAVKLGINKVSIGVCQVDYSGYPDCRAVFIETFNAAVRQALGGTELQVVTPLMNFSKAQIWALAYDLKIMDTIINDTNTDYNGDRETLNEWGYGSLDNEATKLRANGYYEAKKLGYI